MPTPEDTTVPRGGPREKSSLLLSTSKCGPPRAKGPSKSFSRCEPLQARF